MSIFKRILAFFVFWLNRQRDPRDHALSDFDKIRHELIPGDVILVESRSAAGRKLRTITVSRWTHAVLYIGRPLDIQDADLRGILGNFINVGNDVPLMIETRIGSGVTVRPLVELENDHLRVCRPKGLAQKEVQQAIRYAINHLGNYNEGTQLLDLTRFLFPWGLLPSGWRLPLFRRWPGRHTKNLSCSFIAETFGYIHFPIYPLVKITEDQGVQLLRRHPRLCLPFEIDMSPNFEIVKYPFLDFHHYENDRLIPWKGSGLYSGVEQEPALTFQRNPALAPTNQESPAESQAVVVSITKKEG